MIRGITHENGAKNKKDEFSNMAEILDLSIAPFVP